METTNNEEKKMTDSGFSTNDAVLWGAMNNMGRGGYGGTWGGGGYGGHAPFASPGSNAVRVNRNAEIAKLGIDRISDQNEETRRNLGEARVMDNITGGHNRICENLNNQAIANRDLIFQQELRTSDRMAAITAQMNDFRAEAAKCCCDTKLEICNVKAELAAEIKAVESRGIERDLNRAERELQTQKILTTCGCGCGGGVRPCPS